MHVLQSKNEQLTLGFGIKTISLGTYNHTGNDFVKYKNALDYIISAERGIVTYVRNSVKGVDLSAGFGNYVKIKHGGGFETIYAHMKLNSIKVKVGDIVQKGTVIGYMGNTGYVTGAHLHFEIRIQGVAVDPAPYIKDQKKIIAYASSSNTNETINTNNNIYIVKSGDTLSKIAKQYNITVSEIVKLNNIKNANLILPGQKIILKKQYKVIAKIGLNERTGPGIQYKVVKSYPYGTSLSITQIKSGFGKTNSGWVSMDWVK